MARTLPPDLARGLLAAGQRIAGAPPSSVSDTVRAVAALQAQDAAAAALGIRARRPGSTLADVAHARFEERSVARTWVMRGTLHLIPAEDARWMVALLGPIGLRKSARRIAELGVARCPSGDPGGAGGRATHAARARGRRAVPRRLHGRPPAGARLAHRRRRAAGGDHRGAGQAVRPAGRLAPALPGAFGPRRRARPPPRPRPPARGPGGLRGLVGPRAARGPPRLRRARPRGGRGARPHARGSRAGSSRRRRTSACCRCSTRSCSATATAR